MMNSKLLWAGRPVQGLRLRAGDLLLVPFSLVWAGFAVFWEWTVLKQSAPGFFVLWGIPFVLAGLYIVVGRFFFDAAARARTCYAVTTQRVIILSGFWTHQFRTLWLRALPELSLREGRGARGTIDFGASPLPVWSRGASWPGVSRMQPPSFELIEEARHVYDLVRTAQQEAARASA